MQIQLKDTMFIKVCCDGRPGKELALYVKVSEIKRALNAAAEVNAEAVLFTVNGKARAYEPFGSRPDTPKPPEL